MTLEAEDVAMRPHANALVREIRRAMSQGESVDGVVRSHLIEAYRRGLSAGAKPNTEEKDVIAALKALIVALERCR